MKLPALFRSLRCFVQRDRGGLQPEIGGTCLLKLGPADGISFENALKAAQS